MPRWTALVVLGTALACADDGSTGLTPDGTGSSATATGGTAVDATDATGTTASDGDTTGPAATTDDGGSSEDTAAPPFEHELYTLIAEDGRLALHSNLPPAVADCRALAAAEPPCADLDEDGLVDAWEDAVLERLRPRRRFDEAESALDDPAAVLADVGRVYQAGDGSFRLLVMLGYSRDYGSCGLTSHNGDSERVALELAPWLREGAGGVIMQRAYTAAHEGTVNDHGQVFDQDALTMLVLSPDLDTGQPRWTVFPSADKHATYATVEICEGISVVPCVDEDCAPDGVPDPEAYDRLPETFANAGELDAPRLTDLGALGFPGDDAWADQDFCGGLGGTGCSSSVRSKLLTDPFP